MYTPELNHHLQLIVKVVNEFAKERTDPKTREQFEAEVESIKYLLDDSKDLFKVQLNQDLTTPTFLP